jgi:hypothetical protein
MMSPHRKSLLVSSVVQGRQNAKSSLFGSGLSGLGKPHTHGASDFVVSSVERSVPFDCAQGRRRTLSRASRAYGEGADRHT